MSEEKSSILLSDVSIEGDLVEKDKIIVDAKIRGDIKADDIETHSNSIINGNVKSNTAYTELLNRIKVDIEKNHPLKKFGTIKYFAHYDASIKIFKNYPLLGVGNKNFRIECRKDKYFNNKILFSKNRCSTHPHQVHFELLSEHGLIGYFIILFILIRFIIRNINHYRIKRDYFNLNCIFILSLFFVPLLPGSGIFGTFNGTLFWIVFSLSNLRLKKE